MYFQFLIEDLSGSELIHQVMKIIKKKHPSTDFDCKSFHGIGHLGVGSNAREIKTGQILNDLPIYIRGFSRSLRFSPSTIVVVLDNDERDPILFRNQLEQVVKENEMGVECVICIAIEELEAWLLGDENAILAAYPDAKVSVLHSYNQDSICGTWELLADALYKGGHQRLIKDSLGYENKKKKKSEWAKKISGYFNLHDNKSPSFQCFIQEIETRADVIS